MAKHVDAQTDASIGLGLELRVGLGRTGFGRCSDLGVGLDLGEDFEARIWRRM